MSHIRTRRNDTDVYKNISMLIQYSAITKISISRTILAVRTIKKTEKEEILLQICHSVIRSKYREAKINHENILIWIYSKRWKKYRNHEQKFDCELSIAEIYLSVYLFIYLSIFKTSDYQSDLWDTNCDKNISILIQNAQKWKYFSRNEWIINHEKLRWFEIR